MANSYSALGRWFEYLNDDCGYEQWSQYLIKTLKSVTQGVCGGDIGCGNGYFTRSLTKAGYTVKGIDVSCEMLDCAQRLALKEGVKAEFLLGDITKLKIAPKQDFFVAVNDCLNYVPPSKLETAFNKVAACLKKGGAFIFDISSSNKLKNIVGDNMFADDREDITCIWFNSLKEDRVETDVTVFERREDGSYLRFDESHTQYIYEENHIVKLLKDAGFSVRTEGHLGGEKTERINFICKRL